MSTNMEDIGAPVARRKRVRKQKKSSEETTESSPAAAAATPSSSAATAEAEEADAHQPPSKKAKKQSSADAEGEDATPSDPSDDTSAPSADSEETPGVTSGVVGSGYLSQETLNYYRQLAEVLDKNEFENEEDREIFLTNVVEELCGNEAGKLRPRRNGGEDSSPSFVLQRLCSHAKCSRLVQSIFTIATAEQVGMFFEALKESAVTVMADRYGSHVLEAVLLRLPTLLAAEEAQAREGEAEDTKQQLDRIQKQQKRLEQSWKNIGTHSLSSVTLDFDAHQYPLRAHFLQWVSNLSGSWTTLVLNTHASFLLRQIIQVLMGEKEVKSMSETSGAGVQGTNNTAIAPLPAALPAYLVGLEALLPWIVQELSAASHEELEEMARHASGSPVLQTVLRCMHKLGKIYAINATSGATNPVHQQLQSFLAHLLQFPGSDPSQWTPDHMSQSSKNFLSLLLQDRSGSRLMECLFEVGGVHIVSALFEAHMKGRLLELAKHPMANFCVQQALNAVRDTWSSKGRHMLRDAYEELAAHIEELCVTGRSGVVVKLMDACMRVQVKENKLFKQISSAAQSRITEHTAITSNVVGGLLLSPLFKAPLADKDSISVIGSLLVQACMQPGRGLMAADTASPSAPAPALSSTPPCSTVINAFLQLPNEFMLKLALDSAGSRVFEAFLHSPLPINAKQQILRRFQMKWVDLSMNNAGSYVLEKLFALAPNSLKTAIAGDLCRSEKRVMSSRSGTFLFRKLRLEHFKKHQQSWLMSEEARLKKSQMFDDMFADDKEEKKEKTKDKEKEKKSGDKKKKEKEEETAAPSAKKEKKAKKDKSAPAVAVKVEPVEAEEAPIKQEPTDDTQVKVEEGAASTQSKKKKSKAKNKE